MKHSNPHGLVTLRKALLAAAVTQVLVSGAASGATITVNSLLDDGDGDNCTLREAIISANTGVSVDCVLGDAGADTIVFDPGLTLPGIISLGVDGDLTVTSEVTIEGPGADQLTISAASASRVMTITDGNNVDFLDVNLESLTLANGTVTATDFNAGGGGLYARENVTLTNVNLTGHSAAADGGALVNYRGTVTLNNSTISGNETADAGGGIFSYNAVTQTNGTTISGNTAVTGGAIFILVGELAITNSTISGNSATNNRGGGIDSTGFGPLGDATLDLTNSTLVGNSADLGSGLYQSSTSSLTLTNSVIANNDGTGGLARQCFNSGGTVTSNASLVDDNTCSPALAVDPQLNLMLADNGGATQTHAVLAGSPLIDAGDQTECTANTITTDQTGMARPIDGDGLDGSGGECDVGDLDCAVCDIGAFEYVDLNPPVAGLTAALDNVTDSVITSFSFNVQYTDEFPLDDSTFDVNNLVVAPAGDVTAQQVSSSSNGGRTTLVSYTVTAPGGSWNASENGTYTVSLDALQVFDTADPSPNAATTPQVLGTFDVAVGQIQVSANGATIDDGDTTPDTADLTDFGDVPLSTDEVRTFTIANVSNAGTINLTSPVLISGSSRFFVSAQPADLALDAGEATSFDVTFNSTVVAPGTGTVTIANSDANANPYTFDVTANTVSPEIDVTGAGMSIVDGDTTPDGFTDTDFGQLPVGESITRTFTINNLGNANLTVNDIVVSGSGFALASSASSPVAGGASTSFDVSFTPITDGPVSGSVSIDNNDADENPFDFALAGDAFFPDITVRSDTTDLINGDTTPDVADNTDFGAVTVGASRSVQYLILNEGQGTINLTAPISVSGAGFSVSAQPADTSLAAFENTTFTVSFDPLNSSAVSGTVSIPSDDVDENPFTFAVAGQGVAPEIDISGNGQGIADGDDTPSETDGTAFADVPVGDSLARTFTIANLGNENLILDQLTVTGAGFSIAEPSATVVAAGADATVDVTFTPSAAGAVTGTVSIVSDDADESPYTFGVSANGIAPDLRIVGNGVEISPNDTSPDVIDDTDFGGVRLGQTLTRTFTVENNGTDTLSITSADVSFIRFTITSPPDATVEPGQSTTFDVTFEPFVAGPISSRVTLTTNDPDQPSVFFDVTGLGLGEQIFGDGFEDQAP